MQDAVDFGPYRLEGELGAGGMGVVYRAVDRRVPRTVALKILHPGLALDPTYRERFRRESAMLSSVEHPHIVPLYNTGEIDHRLFLDMRFIDGDDLQAALARRGRMPAARAVSTIDLLADALDVVHARGVLHRDLKPKNVMLSGGRFFPVLLDFGIARAEDEAALTQEGAVAGSLEYLSPERFHGAPADRRSDVYSLAGLLVACLTGAAPFPGRTGYLALAAAHTEAAPPRPSDTEAALAPFDPVIARGMAKDPAARFATAAELAAAATAALAQVIDSSDEPARHWSAATPPTGTAATPPTGTAATPPTGTAATPPTGSAAAGPAITGPGATQVGQHGASPVSSPALPPTPPTQLAPVTPPQFAPATPPQFAPAGETPHPPALRRPAFGLLRLLPVTAAMAIVGTLLPWFHATYTDSSGEGTRAPNGLSAWGDGKVGVLVPVLLVLAALQLALPRRRPPVVAWSVLAAGVLSLAAVVAGWFLLPGQYRFGTTGDWYYAGSWRSVHSSAQFIGESLSRGPQVGYFLTIVAAVLTTAIGVVSLITGRRRRRG